MGPSVCSVARKVARHGAPNLHYGACRFERLTVFLKPPALQGDTYLLVNAVPGPAIGARDEVHRNAARALREAQIEALGSADPDQRKPEVWATFVVFA